MTLDTEVDSPEQVANELQMFHSTDIDEIVSVTRRGAEAIRSLVKERNKLLEARDWEHSAITRALDTAARIEEREANA